MIFDKGTKLYAYEVRSEAGENVAYVNYLGAPFIPSIASLPEVMARTVDLLIESPNVSPIVLFQQRIMVRRYQLSLQLKWIFADLSWLNDHLMP